MRPFFLKQIKRALSILLLQSADLFAAGPTTYTVATGTDTHVSSGGQSSPLELRYALNQILNNQAQGLSDGPYTINFDFTDMSTEVLLTALLPPINLFSSDTITIGNSSGSSIIIDGGSSYRPFFIRQGTVTLQNLTIQNSVAQGGNGGGGGADQGSSSSGFGGGGMGAGGALFVDSATVTLISVEFSSNKAKAGRGGAVISEATLGLGGGGGLGGNGGSPFGGGGGYGGNGGNTQSGTGDSFGPGGGGGVANGGSGGEGSDSGGGGGGGAIIGANGGSGGGLSFGGNGGSSVGSYVMGGGGGGGGTGMFESTSGGDGGGTSHGEGNLGPSVSTGGGGGGGGRVGSNGTASGGGGGGGTGGGGGGAGVNGGLGGIGGSGAGGGGGNLGGASNYLGGGGGGGGDGSGGFGGGGGYGSLGGFGGGGGSAITGGFGGGGGGATLASPPGAGGVGGSSGASYSVGTGGDGAGFGGAIFVNGGTINFEGNTSTSTNMASANSGAGASAGFDLFAVTGATLNFAPSTGDTVTLSSSIADNSSASVPSGHTWTAGTGAGAVLKMTGSGTLVLQGANTYAGGTTLSSGTISIGNNGALGGGRLTMSNGTALAISTGISSSNPISIVSGTATVSVASSTTGTLSGAISGSSSILAVTGGGALVLSDASNAYSGGTMLNEGTLNFITGALGTGTVTLAEGTTLQAGGTANFSHEVILGGSATVDTNSNSMTLSGVLSDDSGGYTLTKINDGTLTLSNDNMYSGGTTLSGGTLNINSDEALGISGTNLNVTGTSTLQIPSSMTVFSLSDRAIPISASQILTVDTNGVMTSNLTIPGAISGSGNLTKINAGILTLSGANNSYSGGTTLSGGTLNINSDEALGMPGTNLNVTGTSTLQIPSSMTVFSLSDRAIPISASQTLTVDTNGAMTSNLTIPGAISGSGNLTKINAGILSLSGANNSYSGTTTLSGGTLNIDNVNALGTGTFLIDDGTTIDAFSGNIVNANDNEQTWAGSFTFTGTNNLNLGTGAVSLTASPTVTVSGNILTVGGEIGGSESLTLAGEGTLVLSGMNTYTLGTTLSSGTLNINSDAALGMSGTNLNVTGTGTLQIPSAMTVFSLSNRAISISASQTLTVDTNGNAMSNLTIPGMISGNGSLTKIGGGALTLSNANNYSGTTTVNEGVLAVNGSITSDTTITSGGVLGGIGKVIGTVQSIGGRLKPGNSIGLLTIVDTLTLDSNSITQIEFVPGISNDNSVVEVLGTANLAGDVLFIVDSGSFIGNQSYSFLTADAINGSFENYSFSPPLPASVETVLQIIDNQALLTILLSSSIGDGIPLGINPTALLNYLKALSSVPQIGNILVGLGLLDQDQFIAALNSLSPGRDAAIGVFDNQFAVALGSISASRLSEQRMKMKISMQKNLLVSSLEEKEESYLALANDSKLPASCPVKTTKAKKEGSNGFWAAGFGNFTSQKTNHENPGFSGSGDAFIVGYELTRAESAVLVSGGYFNTHVEESDNTGSGSSQGGAASLYATGFFQDSWYLEAGVLGAYSHLKNKRNVFIGTIDLPDALTAKSRSDAWQIMPHAKIGVDFLFSSGWMVEPFVSFDCAILSQGSYKESGAGSLNMAVKSSTPSLLYSQAGVNFYQYFNKENMIVFLEERVAYVNQSVFGMTNRSSIVFPDYLLPIGGPTGFSVLTYDRPLNLLDLGFEFYCKYKPLDLFVSIAYDGEFNSTYRSNSIQGTLGWFF